jgi:hypothetical protein
MSTSCYQIEKWSMEVMLVIPNGERFTSLDTISFRSSVLVLQIFAVPSTEIWEDGDI